MTIAGDSSAGRYELRCGKKKSGKLEDGRSEKEEARQEKDEGWNRRDEAANGKDEASCSDGTGVTDRG